MIINSFFLKGISIFLIFYLLFEVSCATSRKIPVSGYKPEKLMEYETIVVTLKNDQEFTLTNFAITDMYITGVVVLQPISVKTQNIEKIKIIKLEDVRFIQIKYPPLNRDSFCTGFLVVFGGFIIIWFFGNRL